MVKNVWLSTADGDYATAANWSGGHVPIATEDVIIPTGSPSITSGYSQSGVAIAGFYVEDGYAGTIGDASNYLIIDPDSLCYAGGGLAFVDVNAANIKMNIYGTASKSGSYDAGLYLLGSNIDHINLFKGDVGVAAFNGETSTVSVINAMYLNEQSSDSRLRLKTIESV